MERKAETSMIPNSMELGLEKNFMMDNAMRMSRCHFSIARDIKKPAKNRKMTSGEGSHEFQPSLKYCVATSFALAILSSGNSTKGNRAVTERGTTSLIQNVATVMKRERERTHDNQNTGAALNELVLRIEGNEHDDDGKESADEGADCGGRRQSLDEGNADGNLR